ncbi:hypothetical protein [Exiguobacterium sp. TNDT2]|uniref:hypothetical protein n=1 Tax=Exiguobacterium sp. TNDT2 TaxID=2233531 RepID=UPI000DEF32F1|nr:hypothetical protein [Exiguobacterium sp. TNDT2]
MKQYLLYVLFVLAVGSSVALSASLFGDDNHLNAFYEEDIPLAASIDTELEDFADTFAVLSETFDEPIRESDITQMERLAADPALDEANVHTLGTIDVIFEGRPTTLTVETEVYREDGTYLILYFSGDEDVVLALDDRIMAYYEALGL